MKKIVTVSSSIFIVLGVTDYLLAVFMDIHLTGVGNEAGVYWSPFAFGILGLILYYINIYFLKPEDIDITEESVSQAMTNFISFIDITEGKLYITSEKIFFDEGSGNDSFDILYEDVISVSKTKVMKVFPAIEIETKTKSYTFTGIGRDKIINAIDNFKNNKK